MGARLKIPDCKCVACARFMVEASVIMRGVRQLHGLDPSVVKNLDRELYLGNGCDLCGRDALRVPFVPQIVKDFLRIEYLCEWCRNRIHWRRRELKWPICWGTTPDEELKWFLLHDYFDRFKLEVYKHTPAGMARERKHQEWLASLPKWEEGPVEEIKITLKRRVKARDIVTT